MAPLDEGVPGAGCEIYSWMTLLMRSLILSGVGVFDDSALLRGVLGPLRPEPVPTISKAFFVKVYGFLDVFKVLRDVVEKVIVELELG